MARITAARPPVVLDRYPSLALIPLIPYVAGFVFEIGNLLCHTAIVLHERGVPGYVIPGAAADISGTPEILVGPDGLHLP